MSILYQNLMYNEDVRNIYRIDNVVSWRRTITDIQHTRKEFNDRIGVREYPICAFNNGYIKQHHFPQINKPEIPERDRIPHHLNVDLLKMTPSGFLKDDYYPAL
ncbi:CIC11C00000000310 [Sungouiella intermedia]|uniref:CIC11C00000000310 n=1 Tax=Sungouiella intermedia TaxID=45354 RepID=A0A1L0BSW8_9ASCO|nr:CIC11C00000000310 [[Candida] intermedia]